MKFVYDNFDLLFDEAGSVDAFKKLILDMAVRGKLVPQDPIDEPADLLIKKIKKEREGLIEKGFIKKEKPLPPIKKDEMPFDLPDGWEWLRLREVCHNFGQKKPDKEFVYIDVGSINNKKGSLLENLAVIKPEDAPSRARKIVKSGTLIYSTVRPYLLNIAIVDRHFSQEPIASTAFAIMHPLKAIDVKFLYYYLRSDVFTNYVLNQMVGMAYPAINDANFFKGYVPLPPLNEQKRIIQKIDEIYEMIPQLEEAFEKRTKYNRQLNRTSLYRLTDAISRDDFVSSMQFVTNNFDSLYDNIENVKELRQAILTLAVQGKLVPQDPNDEPASILLEKIKKEKERLMKEGNINEEKPLPLIRQDEVPFSLPDGWEWVRLGAICNYIQRGKSPIYSEIKMIPVVAQKCIQWSGFDISRAKFIDPDTLDKYTGERFLEPLDLLWNSTGVGTLGRINIYEGDKKYEKVVADSHVTVIRPAKSFIDCRFLFSWFSSPEVQNEINNKASGSTKQTELATSTIKEHIVPLPPLKEQKRIVSLIDDALNLCDEIYLRIEQRNNNINQILSLEVIK